MTASAPASSAAPAAGSAVQLPKTSESEQLLRIRHSMSHVMAMAVQKLFPKAQVTIGPWTESGFYYDFDSPDPFTEADLKAIKKEMIRIINRKLPLERIEVSRAEAEAKIKAQNEPYKLEILAGISEPITLYTLGEEWWDLCAGPHVANTGELNAKAFELESVAGAYWRGDENNAQLQRIYGTAWETPEQLAEYQRRKQEALRRDHRRLGTDLDLFSIEDEAGAGLVFWHPRGARMRLLIEDFWRRKHFEAGYELLYTPHVADIGLWKTSGHLDFYSESMFGPMQVDEREYQLKPMNCPFHVLTYASTLRSYRELPIRWAELGTVYRYERPGVMHGLMRVRGFTQDDAHVFCLPDQIGDEILRILDLTEQILSAFDFRSYEINLSTRPDKSIGDAAVWELATAGLIEALNRKGWAYKIDEGGGAFYGPKIDLKIEDEAGAGLVFWHPRGARMRLLIENLWRELHFEAGYELLYTPHVADIGLWKTSGHLDFYSESMFGPMQVDEREYQLKPMNCPFHVLTYASTLRSYRELPIRWAELGTVYRYERPGVMHGLMRVRGFTQDDAHVFCLPEQISDEILRILDLTEQILSAFDFRSYEINLSTRPEKSIGEDAVWELATAGLIEALNRKGWAYKIDEGGGAFYGPKIDLKIEDAIGRMWQCSTIQLDFNLPERFQLEYVAADGSRQRPIMIHRAIFGSLERFFGIMTENYAGDFPFWLAPEQIRLLPVTDEVRAYAEEVRSRLTAAGVRATVDHSGDRLGKLIRNGEQMKIPVLGVIGAKEAESRQISLRSRREGDLGSVDLEDLLAAASGANADRAAGLGLQPAAGAA